MDQLTAQAHQRRMDLIRQAAAHGTLSSAIILSGKGDLAPTARFLAAAMECENSENAPCGKCSGCRKVLGDIHPDVITVRDDEHQMISVDVLRNLRSDAYVLPNEGRRKVYIFPDCALLDAAGQNVLLKVVEDGPPHAAFLFCAEHSAQLLPTIRSRCTEWRVGEEESGEPDSEQALALCQLLARRDRLGLAVFFTELETQKCKRTDLLLLLSQARDHLARALLTACGCGESRDPEAQLARNLRPSELNAAVDILQHFSQQLRFNLNVGHVAGAVGAALADTIR